MVLCLCVLYLTLQIICMFIFMEEYIFDLVHFSEKEKTELTW